MNEHGYSFKSQTSDGKLAKTYVVPNDSDRNGYMIVQRFLTNEIPHKDQGFRIIKTYKDQVLVEKIMSFQLSSLEALEMIIGDIKDKYQINS